MNTNTATTAKVEVNHLASAALDNQPTADNSRKRNAEQEDLNSNTNDNPNNHNKRSPSSSGGIPHLKLELEHKITPTKPKSQARVQVANLELKLELEHHGNGPKPDQKTKCLISNFLESWILRKLIKITHPHTKPKPSWFPHLEVSALYSPLSALRSQIAEISGGATF